LCAPDDALMQVGDAQMIILIEALAKFMVSPRKFRNYATTGSF
jgi:hypothetical protein